MREPGHAETTAAAANRPGAYRMARDGDTFTDKTSGFTLGAEPRRIPVTAWGAVVDQILAGNIVAVPTAGKD